MNTVKSHYIHDFDSVVQKNFIDDLIKSKKRSTKSIAKLSKSELEKESIIRKVQRIELVV